jgi:hypothetical protein
VYFPEVGRALTVLKTHAADESVNLMQSSSSAPRAHTSGGEIVRAPKVWGSEPGVPGLVVLRHRNFG